MPHQPLPTKQPKLPPITPKQQALICLIYRYRFLERKQVQAFMGHTDKRRISAWLKDLREKQFLGWIYDADNPDEISKPAAYFLAVNGIRLLRQVGDLPEDELRKRYKDDSRQTSFVTKCLLLADCCLHLEDRSRNRDASYSFALKTDLAQPDHAFNALTESEAMSPDLIFTKKSATNDEPASQTYLLQLLDLTTPRYKVKSAVRGYINFIQSGEWKDYLDVDEPPITLVACPTLAELIFAKRYAKKTIKDNDLEDEQDVRIRFATVEQLRGQGLTASIWEQA